MLSWVSPVLSWVSVMDWPAKSPDLIPIEQVWDELGCHVRRNHAIQNVKDLAAASQAEWANLSAPFINTALR